MRVKAKQDFFSRALVSTPACCGSSAKKHPDLKDVATQDSQDDEWLEPVGMLRLSTSWLVDSLSVLAIPFQTNDPPDKLAR